MTKKNNKAFYPVGYADHVIKLFSKRTVATHAAFLLPYLKKEMRVLDAGCGPGSITMGFAELVSPGDVVGIDLNVRQLEYAKQHASEKNIKNISFIEGDIISLPFPDQSFDVVYTNAVLCHTKLPIHVITELKRVVKPGGFVAAREMDWGAQLIYPTNQLLRESMKLRERALKYLGNNYRIGRKLRKLFTDVGFENVIGSANCEVIGDEQTLKDVPEYMAKQWEDALFGKFIVEKGWATHDKIKQFQQALRDFPNQPGAFRCWTWCQVIGFVKGK